MKPELTELELRDARDAIMEGVADTATKMGAMPSARHLEDWTAPIVEKIAREHHSQEFVKNPEPRERPNMEGKTRGHALATVDFAPGGDYQAPARAVVSPDGIRAKRETPREEANRWCIERIARDPEMAAWKAKLRHLGMKPLPEGHTNFKCSPCGGTKACRVREAAIGAVLEAFMSKHGDPITTVLRRRSRQRACR